MLSEKEKSIVTRLLNEVGLNDGDIVKLQTNRGRALLRELVTRTRQLPGEQNPTIEKFQRPTSSKPGWGM